MSSLVMQHSIIIVMYCVLVYISSKALGLSSNVMTGILWFTASYLQGLALKAC